MKRKGGHLDRRVYTKKACKSSNFVYLSECISCDCTVHTITSTHRGLRQNKKGSEKHRAKKERGG